MILKAEGIKKQFYRKKESSNYFEAVKPLDFTVSSGELVVIQGRSGSGKSTLLNMLSGILKPDAGKIFYDDTDIYSMKDEALSVFRNENTGFIPQGKSAVMSLTLYENIMVPLTIYGKSDEEKAKSLMERFDISNLKDAKPSELSGGELRRMSIARALMKDPEVIFADEPTGDLDDENTKVVFEALKKASDDGAIVIIVTHEEDGKNYADKMYRMNAGELIEG